MDMTELIKKSNSKIPKVRFKMLLQKVFFLHFTKRWFFLWRNRNFCETENFLFDGKERRSRGHNVAWCFWWTSQSEGCVWLMRWYRINVEIVQNINCVVLFLCFYAGIFISIYVGVIPRVYCLVACDLLRKRYEHY